MSTAASKILRTANAPTTAPDEIELTVAQALLDLENNVADLKAELRPLQISAAREVDVKGGKKAIVVFVPVPQLKAFHKIQGRYVMLLWLDPNRLLIMSLYYTLRLTSPPYLHLHRHCVHLKNIALHFTSPPTTQHDRLTRELEKKFSDRHVVFIGQRRMMRKPTRVSRVKQQRPRSRTLKEVHEKILEDLVYPTVCSPVSFCDPVGRKRRIRGPNGRRS